MKIKTPKLMKKPVSTIQKIAVISLTASLVYACSGSDSSTATSSVSNTAAAVAYSGPGSKWDFDLAADGSFNIEHRAGFGKPIDMTIEGTYARLNSGFVKLSVTGSTGSNAPSAGDDAWALEVPGYALLVKPMQVSSDQMIAMVAAGSCPTGDFNANWVIVKQEDGRDPTDPVTDYFGTFQYNASTKAPKLPAKYSLADPLTNLGAYDLGAGDCSNGILEIDSAILYLTDNGGAIVHVTGGDPISEADDSFIFALGQKEIVGVNALDGEYVGMLFDAAGETGNKVQPVNLSCVSGSCIGSGVSNIDTGETNASGSVTVALTGTVDAPTMGMISGTISTGTSTGALSCMVDVNASGTGKKIVSCVGQSPGSTTEMFNVMFVSKNE